MRNRHIARTTLLALLASTVAASSDVIHPVRPAVPPPVVAVAPPAPDPLDLIDWRSGQSDSTKGAACGWGITPEAVVTERADVAMRIAGICQAVGVDPALGIAIAYQESRLNQNCRAPMTPHSHGQRAEGVMQVLPSTGRRMFEEAKLGAYDGNNEGHNILAGCLYLKEGAEIADGSRYHIAGGYHAGYAHRVWRNQLAIPRGWPKTRSYAVKVSTSWYPIFAELIEPTKAAAAP